MPLTHLLNAHGKGRGLTLVTRIINNVQSKMVEHHTRPAEHPQTQVPAGNKRAHHKVAFAKLDIVGSVWQHQSPCMVGLCTRTPAQVSVQHPTGCVASKPRHAVCARDVKDALVVKAQPARVMQLAKPDDLVVLPCVMVGWCSTLLSTLVVPLCRSTHTTCDLSTNGSCPSSNCCAQVVCAHTSNNNTKKTDRPEKYNFLISVLHVDVRRPIWSKRHVHRPMFHLWSGSAGRSVFGTEVVQPDALQHLRSVGRQLQQAWFHILAAVVV